MAGVRLHSPGLFVTATDTEVGKTVVTCAIAHALRGESRRVGVCKPFATGCRREREGLVNADAEALAHFADCRFPLHEINPVRFKQPLAPAAAAEVAEQPVDWPGLWDNLERLDRQHEVMLVEGVGGLLVPLDPATPRYTVLESIPAIGSPAIIARRPGLGTLNHTAMTVRLLQRPGIAVAGLVINGYDPDATDDPAIASNRTWLHRLTGVPVLATVPRSAEPVEPDKGEIPIDVLDAIRMHEWERHLSPARPMSGDQQR
jgi:dethiobiotin synthetase